MADDARSRSEPALRRVANEAQLRPPDLWRRVADWAIQGDQRTDEKIDDALLGFANSATFGGAGYLSHKLSKLLVGSDFRTDESSVEYRAGEAVETVGEIAVSGGATTLLKHAMEQAAIKEGMRLAEKNAGRVLVSGERAAWQKTINTALETGLREDKKAARQAYMAWGKKNLYQQAHRNAKAALEKARSDSLLRKGTEMHFINPLRDGPLPTLGLPARIRDNVRMVRIAANRAEHHGWHLGLDKQERIFRWMFMDMGATSTVKSLISQAENASAASDASGPPGAREDERTFRPRAAGSRAPAARDHPRQPDRSASRRPQQSRSGHADSRSGPDISAIAKGLLLDRAFIDALAEKIGDNVLRTLSHELAHSG